MRQSASLTNQRLTAGVITIVTSLLLLSRAAAQVETPLYTYPLTAAGNSGIIWPGLVSQGTDGELYSTISSNGSQGKGSVFKITTNGAFAPVYYLCAEGGACATSGENPWGGVSVGADGNLYGTANGGGSLGFGTVFKLTPAGTETTLWNFTEAHTTAHLLDEGLPWYPPIQGQDGNFYGVDTGGYVGDNGVFFKVTSKGALTPHDFNYSNGANPILPVQGTDLNFYGVARIGGDATCQCGAVYKATAAGKITAIHLFKGYPTDGYLPEGVLVQGNDGAFYGTTYQGGTSNEGTVFKITSTGTYTLLYSFNDVSGHIDGVKPETGLVLGSDGNFYGTTSAGGAHNSGTIFQITPTGTETVLYSFCSKTGCSDGLGSVTPLMQHTNGTFYGNTPGNSNGGSVFYSFDMGLPPFSKLLLWQGKVGAKIGILGQGFSGGASVSFGGGAAAVNVVSDTYLIATVPAAAITGSVKVVTTAATLVANHTFLVVPTISSISPTSGAVGSQVVITGSGFTGVQSDVKSVNIGGKAAKFTVNSITQITTTVPVGAVTGKKIVVTTAGGKASSSSTFTVI